MSKEVQAWLKEEMDIHNYTTTSRVKAPAVEGFIRTLRKALGRYFTWTGTDRWIDFLPKFLSSYNNRLHSTTKRRPLDLAMDPMLLPAHKKTLPAYKKKWNLPPIGSCVRLNTNRGIFEKEGAGTWTTELFQVVRHKLNQPIPMVVLVDMGGELIQGAFYPEEVLLVDCDQPKQVEEVMDTRGLNGHTEYYVSYKGWPAKFNEWVQEKPLVEEDGDFAWTDPESIYKPPNV